LNDVSIGAPTGKMAEAKISNPGGTPMDRDTFIITVYCLVAILRTFFERKGLTTEATNWLNVGIESHSHLNW
jgi:hypothetical protein